MASPHRALGASLQFLDAVTSSGTQSNRIMLKDYGGPFSRFGVSCTLASSSQSAACTVLLYGSAAGTTAALLGTTLVTWSTDDGMVAYSTADPGIPVAQVWGEVTLNTTSGAVNAYLTALP
jgi:hypothetical protein